MDRSPKDDEKHADQRRDEILRRMLKTPPEPRKPKPEIKTGAKPAK